MSGKVIALVAGRDPLSEVSCGHSSYVRAHAMAATRAGYAAHIFCVGPNSGTVETDFGIVHRIGSRLRPYRQLLIMGYARSLADAIDRFLSGYDGPHLIHSFGVWGYAGVLAAERLRAKGRDVKTLLGSYTTYTDEFRAKIDGLSGAHGTLAGFRYWVQSQWARLVVEGYERRAYLESDLVTANYESVIKMIRARHGAAVKIRKAPYTPESAFVDSELNGAVGSPPDESNASGTCAISLLTVARNEPNKGIPVLIEALAELRQRGIEYSARLIGGGPLLDQHRRLVASLELSKVVAMPGPVRDILPYLKQADVFVLPSLSEGSGSLALIEAMQKGLAIVASSVDGIVEDLEDGKDAILVKPGSVEEMSAALASLSAQPQLRIRLGSAARQRFVEKFSAGVFSKAMDDLYSELLQESSQVVAARAVI